MSWTKHVTEGQAPENVKRIYDEIKLTFGTNFVPRIFMALAVAPGYLEAEFQAYKKVMGPGHLPRLDKELIGLAVASTKASHYLTNMQMAMCKKEGLEDEAIIEGLAVVDYYNGFDAFADALHIDPDIQPPGAANLEPTSTKTKPKAHFAYVEEPEDEIARQVYADIKKTIGINFVPNIFKSLGYLPGILQSKWAKSKAIMSIAKLKRTTKELIAIAVSAVNACEY